ncbi:MAG: hypothetical protein JXJ17_07345 [Anaerolineae bacterium]|nr:hypothetical protein [Anaerolineae bacterium]
MQEDSPRFPWIALLIGLVIGIAGGLYYGWYLNPVDWVNIGPDKLNAEDQQEYILLVAEAYLQEQEIARASARLAALDTHDIAELVSLQADEALLRGDDPNEVRALTTLAEALGASPMAAEVFSGTTAPATLDEERTVTPTFEGIASPTPPTIGDTTDTPTPTQETLTPTPQIISETDLSLVERETVCEAGEGSGQIEILVLNRDEIGIPAVEVRVEWGGEDADTFFTGLNPGVDPGYADFSMVVDRVYSVTLVGLTEPVVGLDSSNCTTDSGEESIPTYRLTFSPNNNNDDATVDE